MNKKSETPLMEILELFTAPNVPQKGPEEKDIDPFNWEVAKEGTPEHFPGNGLAEHPMLYIGEGCNRIYLVNEGKVIWTYDTGTGNELDDIWMKKNGNIVFSRQHWCGEVTPDKRLVWRYDAGEMEEMHTMQPLDEDRVLMMINAFPPRMVICNTKTNEILCEKEVPYDRLEARVHGQFRRFRMTADNTLLVPYLKFNKVVEYDLDFNEVWRYEINKPWAAIRLQNGNTLITDELDRLTREVNPAGETVWEIKLDDLPEEYRMKECQSCVRLKNGNTILCSVADKGKGPQLVEVNPQKEVVWVLQDWKNLGPATAIQVLDDPGDPEVPGECER